jgi:hypothetical protein
MEFIVANIAGILAMMVALGACIFPLLWNKFKK